MTILLNIYEVPLEELRSRTVATPVIPLKFSGLCDAISVGNLESPTGEEQKAPGRWKLEEMDQFRNNHGYLNMYCIISIYNYTRVL